MLRPRLIVSLLIHKGGLVKTQQFAAPKYVGDPLNAVRIFNEKKEVDELVVLDIDATREGREPDYRLIESLASECRMPLCYGGGVTSAEQGQRIVQLGVEKIAVSAALVERPELLPSMSALIGSQSVVAVLDVRRDARTGRHVVWTRNGTVRTEQSPATLAAHAASLGRRDRCQLDRPGRMRDGYDLELIRSVREAVTVPLTALGGAGSVAHARQLIEEFGLIGVAAGSLFVFKDRNGADQLSECFGEGVPHGRVRLQVRACAVAKQRIALRISLPMVKRRSTSPAIRVLHL